jgi:hypothetical protein
VAQLDLSARRSFGLPRASRLTIAIDAFNVLNHPNFTNPGQSLYDGGVPNLSPAHRRRGGLLYQIGGPRSVQLSARWAF